MIILTRYTQKGKGTTVCKRNTFRYGKLHTIDDEPIPENTMKEILKGINLVYSVDVEKKSDLNLKTFVF